MKDLLISKYIDNELDLDEKITFVKTVKKNDEFYEETLDMLKGEKLLSLDLKYEKPLHTEKSKIMPFSQKKREKFFIYQTLAAAAMILITLSFTIGILKNYVPRNNIAHVQETAYRFVYYDPSAKNVALTGSFTNWQKVYMRKVGDSGYWQIYLKLPKNGLYKYNFIVNGHKIIHDPSNPARIYNGFGGFDSVLRI